MMQRVLDTFSELDTTWKVVAVVGGVAVVITTTQVVRRLLGSASPKKEFPRDTVILHQLGRGPYAPSLSPFVMKLENYLRIANIPYQVSHAMTPGPKGKWPWIEYNGESVTDSEFCIDYLDNKFDVDINSHLSTYDRGVAQGVKVMMDEHICWCVAMFRYIYDPEMTILKKALSLNRLMIWYYRRFIKKIVWIQGTGRHDQGEVTVLLERDLQGVADVLGQKKFLFGDKPCVADCSVFGHLAQLYWHCPNNDAQYILQEKFPVLAAYCDRMKSTYWPDWDDCTTRGYTAEATK